MPVINEEYINKQIEPLENIHRGDQANVNVLIGKKNHALKKYDQFTYFEKTASAGSSIPPKNYFALFPYQVLQVRIGNLISLMRSTRPVTFVSTNFLGYIN